MGRQLHNIPENQPSIGYSHSGGNCSFLKDFFKMLSLLFLLELNYIYIDLLYPMDPITVCQRMMKGCTFTETKRKVFRFP